MYAILKAVIDTSIILFSFERGFDLFEGLIHDLDESYSCIIPDSVLRELMYKMIYSSIDVYRAIYRSVIPQIVERCEMIAVSEDYEFEDADHDLIRLSLALKAPIATNDSELKRVARSLGIKIIYFRESKGRLEMM